MANRYKLVSAHGVYVMMQDRALGDWVKYEDYWEETEELKKELQRIMVALAELAECGK